MFVFTLLIEASMEAIIEEWIIESPMEPLWSMSRMMFHLLVFALLS